MNIDYILPDAPPLPGLRFRPFAGESDADHLQAIHDGRAARDGVDPLSSTESIGTREEFVRSLAAVTASGGEDRTIVAEIDGRVVAYNRFFDWMELDGTRVWLTVGWVLPEWRGHGLGTALLHWAEGRIRERAAAQPGRWEFAANAGNTEIEATALLRDNGYRAAYTVLEMGLDWDAFLAGLDAGSGEARSAGGQSLSEVGITIRAGEVEHAGPIAASVDESYAGEYAGGRYAERFDPAAYAAELAGTRYDPSLWRVAWAGEEVAGQVIPRIERGRAEIYEVSVRPAWRRLGVARALLADVLLELHRRDVMVVRLHTMAEFPTRAVDLYTSLGFRTLKEFPRYRKPA